MKTIFRSNALILVIIIILLTINCKTTNNKHKSSWQLTDFKDKRIAKSEPKEKKLTGEAFKYIEGMILINGGNFVMGKVTKSVITEKDTTLLETGFPRKISISPFYISNHEVTNAEYRQFVYWVRDSIALSLIAQKNPSFYLNKELKILNWSKRSEIYNQNFEKEISPLFIADSENSNKKTDFNTDKFIYTIYSLYDTISVPVYPDTLCWTKDFVNNSYEPLTKLYFWHPSYNNYPVVGISWIQANAYCNWRTNELNKAVRKTSGDKNLFPSFRLATEAEWEYAALSMDLTDENQQNNSQSNTKVFPWPEDNIQNSKGEYLANSGPIVDENGFIVKSYDEGILDKFNKLNYGYTSPVKSFPPNAFKLYDMAGNVAEWVLDVPCIQVWDEYSGLKLKWNNKFHTDSMITDSENSVQIINRINYNSDIRNQAERDSLNRDFRINSDDNLMIALSKIVTRKWNNLDSLALKTIIKKNKTWLTHQVYDEIHDARVLELNKNPRTVKGGSWATGPIYLQCGKREAFSENKSSCRIGFRIAMTYIDLSLYEK